jgi:hypothetical protein
MVFPRFAHHTKSLPHKIISNFLIDFEVRNNEEKDSKKNKKEGREKRKNSKEKKKKKIGKKKKEKE